MRESVIWSVSLPPQMALKAEAPARRENRSRSEPVREALRRHAAPWERERTQAKAPAGARALWAADESGAEEAGRRVPAAGMRSAPDAGAPVSALPFPGGAPAAPSGPP